jgi:hypothetical protein
MYAAHSGDKTSLGMMMKRRGQADAMAKAREYAK